MAQLDQLIDSMLSNKAEALLLRSGRKPCLLMKGAEHAIVKTPLTSAQLSSLAAEIAPPAARSTVAGGGVASFAYDCRGKNVQVDVGDGSQVSVRPMAAAVAAAPAATATPVAPQPRVEAARPVAKTGDLYHHVDGRGDHVADGFRRKLKATHRDHGFEP